MCTLFAATYQRTAGLILINSYGGASGPRTIRGGHRVRWDVRRGGGAKLGHCGRPANVRAPSRAGDPRFREWWARFLRMSASPGASRAVMLMNADIDVRAILPTIRVPTLVLHGAREQRVPVEAGRYLAERIPEAKYVELPGADHIPWGEDAELIVDEVEEFLTGTRRGVEPDRILATVMFTDIVDATRKASEAGGPGAGAISSAPTTRSCASICRSSEGREIDTAGDGFLSTFDGPARVFAPPGP